jgi:hypothetical protein
VGVAHVQALDHAAIDHSVEDLRLVSASTHRTRAGRARDRRLPSRGRRGSGRGPDACLVDGCAREWSSARSGLCSAHAEQRRALPGVGAEQFLAHRQVKPLEPLALCAVAACTRQRRHPDGRYCDAHQQRLRTARTHDQDLDETRWRANEPAIGRGGEVSLRGLAPLVVTELLMGLQQRCRINAVKTNDAVLRALCNISAAARWTR